MAESQESAFGAIVLDLFFKLKASIDAFLALVRIFLRLGRSSKFQIAFL